ncbi:DNA polymerase III subunit delta [Chlorella sorokiniana]|uniref:DNA polymerase III subunit delta n=1 Tax=Chlorella sorokiniana TaxID=3076 RepID=A0A2P6TKU5_CHLSO|nr:DNA polymerase III subunit delta [Chlorella sorokiniana]|eukprot:PRW44895.1 DNA polymerase III subunit delta [Chlorella sorokiniana]
MAHHLAEAICELAAPQLQPCFIRVQTYTEHFPSQMLLLHVRARRLAAGIEVAVYHGVAQDEMATIGHLGWEGTLFAVPRTQAGLEQFAADLLSTSPDDYDELDVVKMELPARPVDGGVWGIVHLDLLPPALVRASEQGTNSPDMAHHLAEAICELAAPPLQPSFIRLVARQGDFPSLTLLLHVRPRQLVAGAEVAVYSGNAEDEEATVARVSRRGNIFALRQTQAGLEQFVSDLIDTSPEEWDDRPCKLALPLKHSPYSEAWDSMQIQLLPPSDVQLRAGGSVSPHHVRLSLPSVFVSEGQAAAVEVYNRADAYAHNQKVRKRMLAEHAEKERQAAAAAAGVSNSSGAAAGAGVSATAYVPDDPDSPAQFEQKYRQLRDETMAEVQAALLATLRQALRWRGTIEFPGSPPLPPSAGNPADP